MHYMGPEMLNKNSEVGLQDKDLRRALLPAELVEVALIDAKTCAATGGMSVSQWHNLVREGAAPQPAVRLTRYTRWALAEVRQFFVELTQQKSVERELLVMERAKKASQAAKVKRQQKGMSPGVAN